MKDILLYFQSYKSINVLRFPERVPDGCDRRIALCCCYFSTKDSGECTDLACYDATLLTDVRDFSFSNE